MSTMRCGSARRYLWPPAGPRPATAEIVEAQKHVEQCGACRAFLADMQAVARQTRRLAGDAAMPRAARERLFTALARERVHQQPQSPPVRTGYRWIIAVGIVAVLVGTWFALLDRSDSGFSRLPILAVAEDHVRGLHQESIATSDRDALQSWINEHIPFAVRILDIADAELQGARICFVDGERGVTLSYRLDDRLVSYYVMPSRWARGQSVTGAFQEEVNAGYRVVAWQSAGLTHAFVSDLSPDLLNELARGCAEGMATTQESVVSCGVQLEHTRDTG